MHIFIEAETFDDLGGWTVETQCREAMGSFWIFAHGIGRPVADAATDIHLPHNGKWHFFVRTRDWSAVWQNGTPAGRFQLLIDKKAFAAELGTNGPEWAWQMAGSGEFVRQKLQNTRLGKGRLSDAFVTTSMLLESRIILDSACSSALAICTTADEKLSRVLASMVAFVRLHLSIA